MKLGLAGVTLVVASGDDGVANFKCGEEPLDSCNEEAGTDQWALSWDGKPFSGKGYFPSFPASSPYVTAVGGSQMRSQQAAGASDAQTATATRLIAAQSQEGGVITTGGGFSVVDPTPEWQQKAVSM
jgi:tripeptidyl-peptidase-1